MKETGLIHIYCGEGKGKTTAAVGLAVRHAGAGGKVVLAQFLKDGTSSECRALACPSCHKGGNAFCDTYAKRKSAQQAAARRRLSAGGIERLIYRNDGCRYLCELSRISAKYRA